MTTTELGRPSSFYYLTVCSVALGGSFQFYSLNVLNSLQTFITDWINQTYTDRHVAMRMRDDGAHSDGIALYNG